MTLIEKMCECLYNYNYDNKYSNYDNIISIFSKIFYKYNIDMSAITDNSQAFLTELQSILFHNIDRSKIKDTETYIKLIEYYNICAYLQKGTQSKFVDCEDGFNTHPAFHIKHYKGDFCVHQSINDEFVI